MPSGRRLGDAKVGELHLPGEGDQDVVGAQIAVHDAELAAMFVAELVGGVKT